MEFVGLIIMAAVVYLIIAVKDVDSKIDYLSQRVESLAYSINTRASQAPIPTPVSPESEEEIVPSIATEPEIAAEPSQPVAMPTPPPLEPYETEAVAQPIVLGEPLQPMEEEEYQKPAEQDGRNFEKFIGENLFGKIGVIVFIIGIGFFVKYAIDNNWINEVTRTILGYFVSVVMLGIGAKLQHKYRTYSSLIAGGAFGVAYVTTAVAFHYYHLFSSMAAFCILVGTTLLMAILAYRTDKRELAIIALVGGFIAPFIASNGNSNELVLLTYLLILELGMAGLSLVKRWSELPVISFVATWLIVLPLVALSPNPHTVRWPQLLFATAFYLLFLAVSTYVMLSSNKRWFSRLLCLVLLFNSFFYLFTITGCVPTHHLVSLWCVLIALCSAVAIFVLYKKKLSTSLAFHTHLALTISFLAIAVPLEFSNGHIITLIWAVQATIAFYLFARSRYRFLVWSSFGLMALTFMAYFINILDSETTGQLMFANSEFARGIVYASSALAVALMCDRNYNQLRQAWDIDWLPVTIISYLVAIGVFYHAFVTEFYCHINAPLAGAVIALFTAALLLGLYYAFHSRIKMDGNMPLYLICALVSSLTLGIPAVLQVTSFGGITFIITQWITILVVAVTLALITKQYFCEKMDPDLWVITALNVLIALSVVSSTRLILLQAGVTNFSAGLSLSLALTGFAQMLIGMRKHLKEVRMISLFTLGIVLAKLVLNDLWSMPAVGKIITFIVLGVLLLVLSFLYQRLKNVLFDNDYQNSD